MSDIMSTVDRTLRSFPELKASARLVRGAIRGTALPHDPEHTFFFWLRAADSSPCYKTAGGWSVGYDGSKIPQNGFSLLDSLLQAVAATGIDASGLEGEIGRAETKCNNSITGLPRDNEHIVLMYGSNQFELRATLKCNDCCIFCNSSENAANVFDSESKACEAIKSARELGARTLVVTGGEPLLVPWLPAAVRTARSLGFSRTVVQTNGRRAPDQSLFDAFLRSGVDEVVVSLQAATEQTLFQITGHRNLEERLDSIRTYIGSGIVTVVNHVVCLQNIDEISLFVDLMASLNPRPFLVAFSVVAPSGRAWANRESTIPSYKDAAKPLLEALQKASAKGLNVVHSEYCGIPTCVEPSLRQFAEPHDPQRPVSIPGEKTPLPACPTCPWQSRCSGVFRRYLEFRGQDW